MKESLKIKSIKITKQKSMKNKSIKNKSIKNKSIKKKTTKRKSIKKKTQKGGDSNLNAKPERQSSRRLNLEFPNVRLTSDQEKDIISAFRSFKRELRHIDSENVEPNLTGRMETRLKMILKLTDNEIKNEPEKPVVEFYSLLQGMMFTILLNSIQVNRARRIRQQQQEERRQIQRELRRVRRR